MKFLQNNSKNINVLACLKPSVVIYINAMQNALQMLNYYVSITM